MVCWRNISCSLGRTPRALSFHLWTQQTVGFQAWKSSSLWSRRSSSCLTRRPNKFHPLSNSQQSNLYISLYYLGYMICSWEHLHRARSQSHLEHSLQCTGYICLGPSKLGIRWLCIFFGRLHLITNDSQSCMTNIWKCWLMNNCNSLRLNKYSTSQY